ncbi:hypothetical protein D7Y27_04330 [Corallococcus sp. AB004]|nr:hypothetical protein D7Y04_15400 [Corallococcus sp. AB038B]RKI48708.1 hypothetical protein D7Y27_04330 [Corallococcus sp. AB004]
MGQQVHAEGQDAGCQHRLDDLKAPPLCLIEEGPSLRECTDRETTVDERFAQALLVLLMESTRDLIPLSEPTQASCIEVAKVQIARVDPLSRGKNRQGRQRLTSDLT